MALPLSVSVPRRRHAKTPARRGVEPWATSGGRFCEANLRARPTRPSYLLDFSICRRCQAVGNWGLPGGVMLATHPPACVDDIMNLALCSGVRKRKSLPEMTKHQNRISNHEGILRLDCGARGNPLVCRCDGARARAFLLA